MKDSSILVYYNPYLDSIFLIESDKISLVMFLIGTDLSETWHYIGTL